MTLPPLARRAAARVLRSSVVNHAARALARARGHRLVLVYHRLGLPAPPGCGIVPSVRVDLFRKQVQALGEVVDLVTLDEVVAEDGRAPRDRSRSRPAVAITFDDDLPSHAEQALPALGELGVPAAFFLSGRSLHGAGPYWFQQLEALLIAQGETHTAQALGLPSAPSNVLAIACEHDANRRRRVAELAAGLPPAAILPPEGIAALVAAGMTIGFHTLDHRPLPGLDDAALGGAVTRGCQRLAAAAGAPLRYFAYPHGQADARSARVVARAGFDAAFTGRPEPLRPGDERHRLGRWEPGPLSVDELLVKLAVRLHRAASPAPRASGVSM